MSLPSKLALYLEDVCENIGKEQSPALSHQSKAHPHCTMSTTRIHSQPQHTACLTCKGVLGHSSPCPHIAAVSSPADTAGTNSANS
jgi:hypothetical protein